MGIRDEAETSEEPETQRAFTLPRGPRIVDLILLYLPALLALTVQVGAAAPGCKAVVCAWRSREELAGSE